jgi:hypothetical protein
MEMLRVGQKSKADLVPLRLKIGGTIGFAFQGISQFIGFSGYDECLDQPPAPSRVDASWSYPAFLLSKIQ